MKKLLLLCLLSISPLFAQNGVTLMVKQHNDRADSFTDRPYGKDDLSYGVFMDMFDGMGGWRLGATYASGLSGPGEADSVITPEITLLGSEGIWETGISLMMDYIDDASGTSWGDLYYQMQLGLNFPVGKHFQLGIAAFFPFSDFDVFTSFDFGELDYGITLRSRF
jgi:hypothetical protein